MVKNLAFKATLTEVFFKVKANRKGGGQRSERRVNLTEIQKPQCNVCFFLLPLIKMLYLIVPGKKNLIKGFIFQPDFISNRNHPWSHRRCKLMCTLKRHLSLAALAVKKANNWAICAGPKTATKKLTGLFFLDCNYYFRQPDARCCYNMLPFSVSVL